MKKRFLLIALPIAAMAFSSATATAQGLKFGIVGGMNLTKLRISSYDAGNRPLGSGNQAGWYVGGKLVASTGFGLGADVALEYSKRMLDINDEATACHSLEIPLNARFNFGLDKTLGFYIATGPQFSFALKNMRWDYTLSGGNFNKQNMTTTWNVGGGVRLFKHLEIGIGYNFALKEAGSVFVPSKDDGTGSYSLEYKPNTFQLQAALLF